MPRTLRVRVDHTVCVGNAMCTAIAPGVFTLNDDRQSQVVDPAGETEEKILEAAENCPVGAILVENADTGERLFPATRELPNGPSARSTLKPRARP